MNILWITNILFPAPCEALKIDTPVVGGWMYSSAKALLSQDTSIKLAVASIYSGNILKKLVIDNICYYLLPLKGNNCKYHSELESLWQEVVSEFHPDITHLHGTEFAHGLAFINACPNNKIIVSTQGLVSSIQKYYYAGIPTKEILKNITFRDLLKRDNIFQQKKRMYERGIIEQEIISKVNHIIGRTSWDKSHALAINPHIHYYFCNETLREEFYKHKWEYQKCEKYSIFLSQAGYPIKALHQVIKALPLILRQYPKTKIYVAGYNITANHTIKEKIKLSGYGKYIHSLMKKYKVEDKIIFTGSLNEQEICNRYLKSNVFVCPSAIENSPNSLGEAQLLGVPCIASYVGGIPDMMKGAEEFMYRFEEFEMLAEKVCDIFSQAENYNNSFISNQALLRHNSILNVNTLLEIYKSITE